MRTSSSTWNSGIFYRTIRQSEKRCIPRDVPELQANQLVASTHTATQIWGQQNSFRFPQTRPNVRTTPIITCGPSNFFDQKMSRFNYCTLIAIILFIRRLIKKTVVPIFCLFNLTDGLIIFYDFNLKLLAFYLLGLVTQAKSHFDKHSVAALVKIIKYVKLTGMAVSMHVQNQVCKWNELSFS